MKIYTYEEMTSLPQKWFLCNEELPLIGQEVAVYRIRDCKVTALVRLCPHEDADETKEYYWDNYYGGSNLHLAKGISHWHPMPWTPENRK